MSPGAIQPLVTSRLAQYCEPIACYVCDNVNTLDSEYCHLCSAPLALAHQARIQKTAPKLISVMGASGAGKTVYLGMLMDMLSRMPQRMDFLVRGAFSISLQQTTVGALGCGEFPEKTANEPDRWNWVHCQIRRGPMKAELVMPDMAGDAILEEVDHPNTYRVIKSLLRKSAAAIVLIDAIELREGNRDQDYFTMKLLSYLSEVEPRAKQGWSRRPVALVFTKVDQAEECRDDPEGFARAHAAGLWQQCQQRLGSRRYFAASVVGCCAWHDSPMKGRRRVPLRTEPHGIVEPFEWILDAIQEKPRRWWW